MLDDIMGREELENRIVILYQEGVAKRALARRFNISRNTVRSILKRHAKSRNQEHSLLPAKKAPQKSKLDRFMPKIEELLEEYPDIKGQRVFEEITAEGYDGGITILREKLRSLCRKPKVEPVIRFETDPGVQSQMDWSPYKINFTRTGKMEVLCFSFILAHCRRQYIDFCPDRKFPTLIRRHQDAFEHFGGTTRHGLYDSEKTVVLRWEANRPVYNPKFLVFATYHNYRPIACRRRRPQTKGKVEEPFKFVVSNLLNGRKFQDLEDLRAMARWWIREKSDKHKHGTTGRPPIELFLEVEKDALQPLPTHPYDTSEVAYVLCNKEWHCPFESNRYSVPPEYVLEILALKATEKEIFIYSPDIELIARHERFPRGAGHKETLPEHKVRLKERYGLEPVRDLFLALGEASEDFLKGLISSQSRTAGWHVRTILSLREQYYTEDLTKAMKHAISYHAFDARSIERILQAKSKQRSLESVRNEKEAEKIRSRLPRIGQRDLSEYTDFLNKIHEMEDE